MNNPYIYFTSLKLERRNSIMEREYSAIEITNLISSTQTSVRTRIINGDLKAIKKGRKYVIKESDLRNFLINFPLYTDIEWCCDRDKFELMRLIICDPNNKDIPALKERCKLTIGVPCGTGHDEYTRLAKKYHHLDHTHVIGKNGIRKLVPKYTYFDFN